MNVKTKYFKIMILTFIYNCVKYKMAIITGANETIQKYVICAPYCCYQSTLYTIQ
jgi:hypothetical protein